MPLSFPPGLATVALIASLTGGAVLLGAPRPHCAVDVRQTNRNSLRQVQLTVSVKPGCGLTSRAVIRFRTERGGIIPIQGKILRPTYPRHFEYWLTDVRGRPGPAVEQLVDGRWKTVWRLGS